ncbi:beta strand repeat-containing protein [Haloferula rosea]|uniref:Autotransporter-associated beta strand repeat-containing protein n=1 Tax=Haloferula rosea TaxID=490093 RepID=A0A934V9S6_9BACT|nr:autotransporter-associated beta strand repeat-containing protein [Haloferula rosea]MBK1825558.1 autotransporter-associated beta strand repeat-containing protein [Haloferula rosea]
MKPTPAFRFGSGPTILSLCFAVIPSLTSSIAQAADFTWDGDTDATWATATNWTADSGVPGTADTVTFNGAGNGNTIIDLGTAQNSGAITFDTASAAAYTIGAGAVGTDTLTFDYSGGGNVILMESTVTNDQLFNADIVLGVDGTAANYEFDNNSADGTLTFAGDISGGSGGTAGQKSLFLDSNGSLILSGDISNGGASSVRLLLAANRGTDVVTLSGDNSFTGVLNISSNRTALLTSDTAGGAGLIQVANTNSQLRLADGVNVANTIQIGNGGNNKVIRPDPNDPTASIEISGIIDINETGASNFDLIATSEQTLTFSGTVAASPGANMTLVNNGTFVISGDNTGFNKDTNVTGNGATLRLLHNNAVGDTVAGDLFVSNTATVELGDGLTFPSDVVFRVQNGGANKILRLVSGATSAEWSGGVNIVETGANNFDVITDSGQTITLSGAITGTGAAGLSKFGDGDLVLSGTSTYTGATQVNEGTLSLAGSIESVANVNSGGTLSLDYATSDTSKLSDAAALNLNGGALDLSGGTHGEVVASTTLGAGTASSVTRSSGTAVLHMNAITPGSGAAIDFGADNIATTDNTNTNGILGAWATVGGTDWAANATNGADGLIVAYTGGYTDVTLLESGPKVISNDPTSQVRVIDGTGSTPADLTLGSAVTTIDTLKVSATGGLVTIDPSSQTLELTGLLVEAASGGLTIGNGVSNGVLRSAGTELNVIANAATTVNSEIADGIGGASALVKTGTGTVTLTGANTFSGVTTAGEGILELSNSLALQNSALDTSGSAIGDATNGLKTTVTTLTLGGLTGGTDLASLFTTTSGGYDAVTELTLNPGTGTSVYSGVIADGAAGMSLVKTGAGAQTLTGVSTYTGGTTLSEGTLNVSTTGALGTGTITLDGGLLYESGGTVNLANDIDVTGTAAIQASGGGNFNLNGAITGSGTLNAGGTAPSSSVLIADDLSGFTGTMSHESVNQANNLTFSAAVNTTAAFSLTGASSGTNRSLSFNGGATIGELSGDGGRLRTAGALVVNQSTTTSYAGTLENSGSAMSLEKQGTGILTLTGNSSYTGSVTATGGGLVLHRPAIVNGVSKQYTVNSPATLEFFIDTGLGTTVTAGYKLDGDGTFKKTGPDTFNHYSSGSNIAMGSGGLIWIAEGTWNFGGATPGTWVSNLSDLQVDGGATLEGRSTTIRVDALDGAGTLGIGGQVANGGGLIVGVDDGNGIFSGVIQDTTADGSAYSLEKQGTGTQTLSGINTYSGDTTVTAGTLTLADGGQLLFEPMGDGVNNQVSGFGSLNLDGEIYLDLSGADSTDGNSWLIVDVASLTETFGATFTVNSSLGSFSEDAGVWTLRDGAVEWTFSEATGTLTAGLTPFGTWAGATGATPDPTANDDTDSLSNLLEFAFGTDPLVSDAVPLDPSVPTAGTPALSVTYGPLDFDAQFVRRKDGSVNYTVQFSNDLSSWENSAETPSAVANIDADYEIVEVSYPIVLSNGKKARFFRVEVLLD